MAALSPALDATSPKRPHALREEQVMLLESLASTMDQTPAVFGEASRNRAMYQKHLVQKLEETLRLSKNARAHLLQKAKHVRDTAGSCTSKFEHEMSMARNRMQDDLSELDTVVQERLSGLEQHMSEAEAALETQVQMRKAHIEATLGPIRDEAARISAALIAERKARKLQEEAREKMLADEIQEITTLIDKEKVARTLQFKEIAEHADSQEQRVAKHQYQLDKQTREKVQSIRAAHQAIVNERLTKQHQITESIASFIKRYREKMGSQVPAH
jgi:hypothetical protein